MGIGKKPDLPPLLAPGRHVMTVEKLKTICVIPFPNSENRPKFHCALEEFVRIYLNLGIVCEIWLDGSYLTTKKEPADLDLAVIVDHDVGESLTSEQRKIIEDTDTPEFREGLDSFSFVKLAKTDPLYGDELVDGAHTWHEQWGIEHSGEWLKGFAVLKIGETDVGLRICS